jgi:Kef-type K+ transport system membrane component KefB
MEILYLLLLLLLITRIFGELADRIGQPPLVGELIAGIILGLSVQFFSEPLSALSDLHEDRVFIAITDLGIFFLMLMGGIEMRPREIIKSSAESFLVALSAMVLPLILGFVTAWFFLPDSKYRIAQALFVGTALAITAVPVTIRVLLDLGKLDSRVGRLIVTSAVFDDVLSLILLAVLTAFIKTGELPEGIEILFLVGKILLFLVISITIGLYLLPRMGKLVKHYIITDEFELSFLIIIGMGFSVLAEILGMHFIMGAFVAGLFFVRRTINPKIYEDVKGKISGITTGFLAPFFFASIGLHLDLQAFVAVPLFLILLIVVAFIGKFIGAAVPCLLVGFTRREAVATGVALSARGAVELIIADIALRAGLFSHPEASGTLVEYLFSVIVIVAIVTTVLVPIVLRFILSSKSN